MPKDTLEELDIAVSGMAIVYDEEVIDEDDDDFSIEASTSAKVWIESFPGDDLTIQASTSAMVVVKAASGVDDLHLDVDEASTSAKVYVDGAHDVDIDDISTSAYLQLTGDYLEEVEVDDLSTSASLFAEYSADDSEMTIDDISTSAEVILKDCDSLDIEDSFQATIVTDNESNCDDVSKLTSDRFNGLTCTVVDDISSSEYAASDIPSSPDKLVMDVDLSTELTQNIFQEK